MLCATEVVTVWAACDPRVTFFGGGGVNMAAISVKRFIAVPLIHTEGECNREMGLGEFL